MKELLNISSKKVFNLLLIAYSGFYLPIAIIGSILALLNIVPATLNDQSYVGIRGFFIPILFAPIFVLMMTTFNWLVLVVGVRIARFFVALLSKSKA